ncbi:MAG: hypothetical protein KAG97_00740, partial [Victivallales bacterium]|nr:hypothetical protein [Victivallales bacterium]
MSLIKEIEEQWIPEAIRFGEDAESGSIVDQITSEPVTSTNIYGEQRFASADGARIAISRKPFGRPSEIWVCDLRSMRLCKAVVGDAVGATSPKDSVYYTTKEGGVSRLMCLNLADLTIVELHDFGQSQLPRVGAVSPDRRYFVGGPFDVRENVYSLHRIDLESGESDVLCEVEDMFNPHLQFGPSGTEFIIQINRGGQTANTGKKVANVGPLGATLAVGDVVTGEVTAMPIGRPHTPPISGHEAWIGDTGGILFSAAYYKVSVSSFVT